MENKQKSLCSMNFPVAFLWIQNPRSIRLAKAQEKLEESILSFGLDPLRIDAGRDLVKLGVALARAREICGGTGFVWCNSDVILTKSPYDLPESSKTYGFHRREIPSGEINLGVDMFYIPNQVWDAILSKNFPPLLIGASYVDRWIPRYLEKVDRYENLKGYIDHPTHPTSSAAGADADLDYQHNFRVYRQWAKRYDLDPIDAPPYLVPGIGHVWGVRDGMSRLMKKIIHGSRGA